MFEKSDDELISQFYKLETRQDVSNLLEIKDKSLRYFLYVKRPEKLYKTFEIPKKNGGTRKIHAPNKELKNIQKKMAYILNLIYEPKICTHGFVKNKDIFSNASKHIRKNWLVNIDLKDFFQQIHFGRICGMFANKPYNIHKVAATVIAQIACCNGVLPQGAPSSPILTNMICKPLDNKLLKFAKKYSMDYSRYADDITFSFYKSEFTEKIVCGEINNLKIGRELDNILKKNSFTVNEEKIFLNSSKTRQEVTGLTVNRFVNVKREYIKNLRSILYQIKVKGPYNTARVFIKKGFCKNHDILAKYTDDEYKDEIVFWFKQVIKGKINFINQAKGKDNNYFLSFARQANQGFQEELFDMTLIDRFMGKVRENVFVILYDNGDNYAQGSGFILNGYGLITNFHVTESAFTYNVYNEFGKEFWYKINKDNNRFLDKSIDYALYKHPSVDESKCFSIGDSESLVQGNKVKIIGYPHFQKGNTPYIQDCYITSINRSYMGSVFYTVSGKIGHGASGGLVLNSKEEIIGVIKGGMDSIEEQSESELQGFIPIHIILKNIALQTEIMT